MKEITSIELKEFGSKLLDIVGKYYLKKISKPEAFLQMDEVLKQLCVEYNIKYFEPEERFRNN